MTYPTHTPNQYESSVWHCVRLGEGFARCCDNPPRRFQQNSDLGSACFTVRGMEPDTPQHPLECSQPHTRRTRQCRPGSIPRDLQPHWGNLTNSQDILRHFYNNYNTIVKQPIFKIVIAILNIVDLFHFFCCSANTK